MVKDKVKPKTKARMFYLPERTEAALNKYLGDNFPPKSNVFTATLVQALDEYLDRKGYPVGEGGGE